MDDIFIIGKSKKELYSLVRKTTTFSSVTTNKYPTKENASTFLGWQSE